MWTEKKIKKGLTIEVQETWRLKWVGGIKKPCQFLLLHPAVFESLIVAFTQHCIQSSVGLTAKGTYKFGA